MIFSSNLAQNLLSKLPPSPNVFNESKVVVKPQEQIFEKFQLISCEKSDLLRKV